MDNRYYGTWRCYFGVAIKNESKLNSVYSLVYYLEINLYKRDPMNGVKITEEEQRNFITKIFYYELYNIYAEEVLNLKAISE